MGHLALGLVQSFCVLTIFVLAPVVRRQTCKQSTANRSPRNFTSAWFSPGRPLWLRRLTSSEQTALVRFRLKAKSSLVLSLLLFPKNQMIFREPCLMLQRSTFDWTGCCLSAACHGVIHAVLPHYLFQKEQAACPFRGQQAESICSWIMKLSRNAEANKKCLTPLICDFFDF